ncbi:energy-coupling factor transporter transmembrane component T family protein [Candidatus Altiarchaeota archaeon]
MHNQAKTYNWILWMLAAMAYNLLTYNPVYLGFITFLLIIISVQLHLQTKTFLKTGLILGIIPLIINLIFVHRGNHILFYALGPVTLESLIFSLSSILILVNMVLVFGIFLAKVSPDSLVRVFPNHLSQTAIILSIGLRFVPTIQEDGKNILDAQRSRGLKIRKGRIARRAINYLAVLIPLLSTSFERSQSLAEALEARGYSKIRSNYGRTEWAGILKIRTAALTLSVLLILVLKSKGLLDYWPYESLPVPVPNPILLFSMFLLLVPLYKEKDE